MANQPKQSDIHSRWILWPILVLALTLRIWGFRFGSPFIYHPDESKLVQPALELINFNRLNLHPGHFIYPAGYIYILAIFFAIRGVVLLLTRRVTSLSGVAEFLYSNSLALHLVGRMVSAIAGAFTTLYHCLRRNILPSALTLVAGSTSKSA